MHILLTVIMILGTFGAWLWRMRMAKRGQADKAGAPKSGAKAPQRQSVRYRAGQGGLGEVDDPREAGAIMMMLVALARGGPLSPKQGDVIESEIAAQFDFSGAEAEELAAHAAWVSARRSPVHEDMRRLSQLIMDAPQLGSKEIIDLDAMLVAVSEAEGLPTRAQLALLQIYRDMAGLKT